MNKTQKVSNKMLSVLLTGFVASLLVVSTGCPGSGKPDDPCEGIICINGGTCVNGICECPEGFEGADCGQEKVPDNIRIAKITYTKMPEKKDNGDTWDVGAFPAAFPGLKVIVYRDSDPDPNDENWVAIWDSENDIGLKNDANPTQTQVFVPTLPTILNNPEQKYRVSLYDWDPGPVEEFMGGITFVPYAPGQSHPAQIIQENSKVRFVLDVTYDF